MGIKPKVIMDASTWILLAKSTILRICMQEWEAKTTKTVEKEVFARPGLDDARLMMHLKEQTGSPRTETVETSLDKELNLGRGEAECLEMAIKEDAVLATDDYKAIRAARMSGVKAITAVHCLIRMVDMEKINRDQGEEKLKTLQRYGRYNQMIIEDAKKQIKGETK